MTCSAAVRCAAILTTSPRIEAKIPVPASLLDEVDAWVRLHPAHWRRTYPPRRVNNLYFDTLDYAGLNANLAGIAERAKLRLRWYGPDLDRIGEAQFELKQRQGSAGWKEVVPMACALDLSTALWSTFDRDLCAVLGGAGVDWLSRFPAPILINSYRRAYYATPDGELRLTVDTGLATYDQRVSGRPNLRRRAWTEDVVIVELKAPVTTASMQRLSAAVSCLPARVDRFSKYVHGAMAAPDL